ncbi:hypothetical protein K458DRAFT_424300 [Lentithecium fluviatile CBS 122367]|uniref:Uncharacterized protein n=1 Tax=Lentithecium fluviatile CBS 122367 TaxID=1168545 RepID=A0A6G1IGL4_9PLEO|nr:hypothetical protein K458DRAFT_424300 [Lentithecium fluviatile CBS 122367]
MVSATDIITYIGVPLAVLGVLPILYFLLSASYTRYCVRRKLQKSGVLSSSNIRTKFMSGVVEVGLPVFRLIPYRRSDPLYWGKSDLIPIDGASWRPFPLETKVLSIAIVQLGSSDKIVLPAAAINFHEIVEFLLDRGARFCPQGVQNLSDFGIQTPVDTRLMVVGPEPGTNVMTVARPAIHHATLSVQLHWVSGLESTGRNQDSIPPASIDVSEFPINEAQPQRAIIVKMGARKVDSAESKFEENPDMRNIIATVIDNMNRNGLDHNVWFATAIVAVFGALKGTTYKFEHDASKLFFCEQCLIPLDLVLSIVDINTVVTRSSEALRQYREIQDAMLSHNWEGKISQTHQSRATALRNETVTDGELTRVVVVWQMLNETERSSLPAARRKTHTDCTNCTDMSGLLYFCLRLLQDTGNIRDRLFPGSNPVQLDPGEAIMTAAERILRIMVFEDSFAKQVLRTLNEVYMWFSEDKYKDGTERDNWVHDKKRQPFETGAALILLISIGLRAGYLVAGEKMGKCTARWQSVYIS